MGSACTICRQCHILCSYLYSLVRLLLLLTTPKKNHFWIVLKTACMTRSIFIELYGEIFSIIASVLENLMIYKPWEILIRCTKAALGILKTRACPCRPLSFCFCKEQIPHAMLQQGSPFKNHSPCAVKKTHQKLAWGRCRDHWILVICLFLIPPLALCGEAVAQGLSIFCMQRGLASPSRMDWEIAQPETL